MSKKLVLRFDVDRDLFRPVRLFIAELVRARGGGAQAAYDIEVVTAELLSNAYKHAYALQSGPLDIELAYDGEKIELTLSDDGDPIADSPTIPTSAPPGLSNWGLYVVGQLTDESAVIHPRHDGRGVAVRVVKYLQDSHKDEDP